MAAKSNLKPARHIPQRTCAGCRSVLAKRTLTRVVRTPEGVYIDPTSKLNGRGAYVHSTRECWERALKGALAHALKTELTSDDRARLESYFHSLPTETKSDISM